MDSAELTQKRWIVIAFGGGLAAGNSTDETRATTSELYRNGEQVINHFERSLLDISGAIDVRCGVAESVATLPTQHPAAQRIATKGLAFGEAFEKLTSEIDPDRYRGVIFLPLDTILRFKDIQLSAGYYFANRTTIPNLNYTVVDDNTLKRAKGTTPKCQRVFTGMCVAPTEVLRRIQNPDSYDQMVRDAIDYAKLDPIEIPLHAWTDLGHDLSVSVTEKHKLVSREFNDIFIDYENSIVIKTSRQVEKLKQEYYWYQNVPNDIALYTPRCRSLRIDQGSAALELELIPGKNASEIWNDPNVASEMKTRCIARGIGLLRTMARIDTPRPEESARKFRDWLAEKNAERYSRYSDWQRKVAEQDIFFDVAGNRRRLPSVPEVLDQAQTCFAENDADFESDFCHGDYNLTNLVWDPNFNTIKMLDPKGYDFTSSHSSALYDIAKFSHSVLGDYEKMLTGVTQYDTVETDCGFELSIAHSDRNDATQLPGKQLFRDWLMTNGVEKIVRHLEATLFATMVPLHSDSADRQKSFILFSRLLGARLNTMAH